MPDRQVDTDEQRQAVQQTLAEMALGLETAGADFLVMAVNTLHAVAPKGAPGGRATLDLVNSGLAKLKSSGRWFDGWRRPNPGREPGISPVAAARTWLLAVGWRRHGLIAPADVPGGT